MPTFCALAQHDALCDLQRQLRDGEAVFAFLDDGCVVALPERTRALYDALSNDLQDRARIRLHEGKTRIWILPGSRLQSPTSEVTPMSRSGSETGPSRPTPGPHHVLGSPLGHDALVAYHL